jgi:hypothetical protein
MWYTKLCSALHIVVKRSNLQLSLKNHQEKDIRVANSVSHVETEMSKWLNVTHVKMANIVRHAKMANSGSNIMKANGTKHIKMANS